MRTVGALGRILCVLLTLVGCSGGATSAPSGNPRVAVSIFPLYDIARRIGGERLDVVCILPPGQSEHGYDPSPREMARISGSRMAIVVGLEMDEWAERIVRGAASGAEPEIVRLGPSLDPRRLSAHEVGLELESGHGGGHEDDDDHNEGGHHDDDHDEHAEHHDEHHHHGGVDPHFWLDPVRMQRAATQIAAAFSRLDPEGAAGFDERARQVRESLAALHAELQGRARAWGDRPIVTFHGSFGYFAERYGVRIAAVIEPFPGREPTPRYMQDVLAAISASHAAALFSEPQLDPRPARVIAGQAGVPLHSLDPIGGTGELTSYEALLRANAATLTTALAP